MKTQTVLLGVILLIVGAIAAVILGATDLYQNRTHVTLTAGGIGLAVIGGIIAALGATSKVPVVASQFKCSACGATFGSEAALNSHTKDKHGK
jgi:C2H2-type zinc finger